MWRLTLVVVLVLAAPAWADRKACPSAPFTGGTLGTAQVAQGATTHYFQDATASSMGVQAYITAGTATVSVQACCRDAISSTTGCDADAEWQDLGGCVQGLDSSGTRNMLCPITPAIGCRYRGFIADSTCSSCSVDFTYSCSSD